MNYSLLRRDIFRADSLNQLPPWDLFLSAYNESERVSTVFRKAVAGRKEWLVHPEYNLKSSDLPTSDIARFLTSRDEAEFWNQYFDEAGVRDLNVDSRVCVDITGFMRPHVMLLPLMLRRLGFSRLNVLYSDPLAYAKDAETSFTKGTATEVRQVRGFEGAHGPSTQQDLLVIGCGYDDKLISTVAEDKRALRKLQMFGLPSLQPHMYEENRLRAFKAEEEIGPQARNSYLFAPAHDPFATAQELHTRLLGDLTAGRNIYLSPLATKAQALGFAIFYLSECIDHPVSMIFPYAEYYARETSIGLARVRLFGLELDWFNI